MRFLPLLGLGVLLIRLTNPAAAAIAQEPAAAAAAPTEPNPAGPVAGGGGDWLAYLHVRPAPGGESQSRAVAGVLAATVQAAGLSPFVSDDEVQPLFRRAMHMAAAGHETAVWALPAPAAGDAPPTLALRVWNRAALPESAAANLAWYASAAGRAPHDWQDAIAAGTTPLVTIAKPLSPEAVNEWPHHRAAAAMLNRGNHRVVFELALNVNAFRQVDDAFPDSRGAAGLEALRLPNVRVIGLHAWIIPAADVLTRDPSLPKLSTVENPRYTGPDLLCVAATTSARSHPVTSTRARLLTTDFWPLHGLGQPPATSASLALAARSPWRTAMASWLDLYAASLAPSDRTAFNSARAAWRRAQGPMADRLAFNLSPYIGATISASTDQLTIDWRVPLKTDAAPTTVAPQVKASFAPLAESLAGDPSSGLVDIRMPDAPKSRWAGWSGRLGLMVPAAADQPERTGKDATPIPAMMGQWVVRIPAP